MSSNYKIPAVIIDDQPSCIESLSHELLALPNVELVGTASSVSQAIDVINQLKPQLVFLDVDLGDGTGFDVLKHFPQPQFRVVFVTAFDHYAVKAFRFSAVDYLLKPANREDLIEAVDKVRALKLQQYETIIATLASNLKEKEKRIVVRTSDDVHLLAIESISHIEGDGAYSHIHCTGRKRITVSQNLKHFEDTLTEYGFFRCHQSHMVNFIYVESFKKAEGGYLILNNGVQVPVSHRKRDALMDLFKNM